MGDKLLCPTLVRISKLAAKLDESKKDSMVLGIDTDSHKIFVKSHGQTTTAIYKKYWSQKQNIALSVLSDLYIYWYYQIYFVYIYSNEK